MIFAMILPVDADPVVVARRQWDNAAIREHLGMPPGREWLMLTLDWAPPGSGKQLVMFYDPDGQPPNPKAALLADGALPDVGGDVLIATEGGPVMTLTERDLYLICVRLLVDETRPALREATAPAAVTGGAVARSQPKES